MTNISINATELGELLERKLCGKIHVSVFFVSLVTEKWTLEDMNSSKGTGTDEDTGETGFQKSKFIQRIYKPRRLLPGNHSILSHHIRTLIRDAGMVQQTIRYGSMPLDSL